MMSAGPQDVSTERKSCVPNFELLRFRLTSGLVLTIYLLETLSLACVLSSAASLIPNCCFEQYANLPNAMRQTR